MSGLVVILYNSGIPEVAPEEGVTTATVPCPSKLNRPSLAKIILSMDNTASKQQSLGHILAAFTILTAR